MKIGAKILCVILITSLVTLLAISAISYTQMLNLTRYAQDANIQLGITASDKSRSALLTQAEDYLQTIVREQVVSANVSLVQVHDIVSAMAGYISGLHAAPENFAGIEVPYPYDTQMGVASAKYILAPNVLQTEAISQELRLLSNAAFMFGPTLESNPVLDNTYLGTESGISYRFSRSNLYNPDYDPRLRDWYKTAMASPAETVWLDTYLDAYGAICVTCAQTFTDAEGTLSGVVAVDITLENLISNISNLKIGQDGYAFLLDSSGNYIVNPRLGAKGFGISPRETSDKSLRQAISSMLKGEHGTFLANIDGESRYVVSARVEETGWTLCVTMPIAEVIAPADATQQEIDGLVESSQQYIRATLSQVLLRFIIIFAVTAIAVVAFSFVLSYTITRPIKDLALQVRRIGKGDMDASIAVKGRDEIAELGNAFNRMTGDLKEYIAGLERVTAEKERINSELSVASGIQNDMLPRIFPNFVGHQCLDMHARMEPAKHVGGDFYDFFFLDEAQSKIALTIADVSGKGVPAALFMVIAKTLLRTHLLRGLDVAATLQEVNNLLCEDNSSSMFVTVFLCVLDLSTGVLSYSNAGHNKPLLARAGEPYAFMDVKKSLPVAVMENTRYRCFETTLEAGSRLYLYTDGVNEAERDDGAMYGNDRLLETVNALRNLPPDAFDEALRASVREFVDGAEQSDDITTLSIYFKGPACAE